MPEPGENSRPPREDEIEGLEGADADTTGAPPWSSATEGIDERAKWNRRYAHDRGPHRVPSALSAVLHRLPHTGRALEVAGGTGAGALALARRGLSVTLADVSDVALDTARQRARDEDLELATARVDLRTEPLPAGPWDVIGCFHFLDRELFGPMTRALGPGGILVVAIATVTNLERHDRPPRRFLLEPGELPTLAGDLVVVSHTESWTDDGIHEARLVAHRPA